jgi:rare lipoprotein A
LTVRALLLAVALALLFGCHRAPPANPHYVLGAPYQSAGVWFYPRDSYNADETGLAVRYASDHASLTSDGERYDEDALAITHATLQLPAIARLTNLENGRQIDVRINDRGTPTPHRLTQVSPRVATLLAFPRDGVVRVRLQVLAVPSHDAVDAMPDAPKLALNTAPVEPVQQADLPPPGTPEPPAINASAPESQAPAAAPSIARLPETIIQTTPDPGELFVELGTFENYRYAELQRAYVGGLGARVVATGEGRRPRYRVEIGPLIDVRAADSMLDRVLGAGVTEARILVR